MINEALTGFDPPARGVTVNAVRFPRGVHDRQYPELDQLSVRHQCLFFHDLRSAGGSTDDGVGQVGTV